MTIFRRCNALAVLALVLAGATQAAVHDANEGLSVDRGRSAERRGAEILHPLRVDRAAFEAASGRGRSLALPSTDVAAQRARFERSERRNGDYTWIGKVDTELGEQAVVVTFGKDAVFGTIPQRRGPPLRVETQRGRHVLVEGEARRKMQAGSRDDSRIPPAGAGTDEGTPPAAYATTTTATGTAPVVDVLVAYTPSLVSRYGSTSAALTRLSYLESLTNQAYADTPANIRIRVVARVPFNYTSSSDNDTVLDLITYSSSSPVKAQIDAWRQQYGADLVSVVRAFDHETQTSCGVAWIGGYHGSTFNSGWGFSVVSDGSDSGYYCVDQTFAHELGHNMGSHHDIDTAGGDYGAYSYSRGYRRTLSGGGFATVMAYTESSQQQLNRFSNPALAACMNQACGVSSSSDNARGLTNAAARVAAFRSATTTAPSTPSLAVANATVTEGNSGTRTASFRVTLSAASASTVSFDVSTANGSAVSGSDYVALPATRVSIAAGTTTRDIAVTVNGDTTVEANETFSLRLANASGATIADSSGTGTITNDDAASTTAQPSLSIANVAVYEGNSGTRTATFTVRLSAPAPASVTYLIRTVDGTASSASDYVATSQTQTIAAGASSRTFPVTIRGDALVEPNENYIVKVTNVSGATVADGSALGTIRNDDVSTAGAPTLTISDPVVTELDTATSMRFVVRLSQASSSTVTFNVATVAGGTASAGSDYAARSLSGQSFAPGTTSKVFTVAVYGDNAAEGDETVFADVTAVSGANVGDARGVGRIVDDD